MLIQGDGNFSGLLTGAFHGQGHRVTRLVSPDDLIQLVFRVDCLPSYGGDYMPAL